MSEIDQVVLQRILSFFNQVRKPVQITERILDDPGYGEPTRQGRGVSLPLAERTLAARDALSDRAFDTLEQIGAVKGVGPDTLHDIVYSFSFDTPLCAFCRQESGTPYPEARQIIQEEFELDRMTVDISSLEVQYQSTVLDNAVEFGDALRAAITSFMNDDDDCESPLMLLQDNLGFEKEEAKKELVTYMNRPSTRIALVAFAGGSAYPPEGGESIEDNWVFFLMINTLSDHLYWAIVDRSGEQPVYHYGFN
jgi:hypothetical protein